jgi:hypothetical protein
MTATRWLRAGGTKFLAHSFETIGPADQRDPSRAAVGDLDSPSRIDAVEPKACRTRNAQTVEVLVSLRAH